MSIGKRKGMYVMKMYLIIIGNIFQYPPAISLLNVWQMKQIPSIVVTTESEGADRLTSNLVQVKQIPINYERKRNIAEKFKEMFAIQKHIWSIIDETYCDNDIIWVMTDVSLKHMGKKLLKYNYILYMLELSEDLTYYKKLPMLKMDKEALGNNALATVVPEYNRAHIIATWWNLKKLPLIIENKPYNKQIFRRNEVVTDSVAADIIRQIGKRKIILYQGLLTQERPLDAYVRAINQLGDDYAFVVMSGGEDIYANLRSDNYYFIPFVDPPDHLRITSHAFIGVLSYYPTDGAYSPLNALYCAPNKTFEYSMFGIPMIGNDIPGLRYVFNTAHNGVCIDNKDEKEICTAIKYIEKHYEEMSKASHAYYSNTDTVSQVENVISIAQEHMCEKRRN